MGRPKKSDERTRLNLVVDQATRERIEAIQEQTGADTMSESVRRAVAIYERMLTLTSDGAEIVLRTTEGAERIIMIS